MQMAISTTGRCLLCILCFVYVLSKMLKLCGAEGSSFRLGGCCQSCVAEAASWFCSLDAVSLLLLKQRLGVSSDSLIVGICQTCFWDRSHDYNAECSEVSFCQMVSLQWLEPSASAFRVCDRRWLVLGVFCLMHLVRCRHSDLNDWSHCQNILMSEWGHASPKTRSWCCWALWVSISPFSIAYC
jgi:hypothetical protein